MISEAVVNEVRRRLATGKQSMRRIASTTGVSRSSVANIAHGTRRRRATRRAGSNGAAEEPLERIERCPECGVTTPAPCRACRVRDWIRNIRQAPPPQVSEEPLQLELAGEWRQRYEEVHARRMRDGWEDD